MHSSVRAALVRLHGFNYLLCCTYLSNYWGLVSVYLVLVTLTKLVANEAVNGLCLKCGIISF
jgi:hypothetical protein